MCVGARVLVQKMHSITAKIVEHIPMFVGNPIQKMALQTNRSSDDVKTNDTLRPQIFGRWSQPTTQMGMGQTLVFNI